jgi:shikimate kinase
VGRRIAANTGRRFVDTDELITSKEGRSISKIFAAHGEAHFRDLETAALAGLAEKSGMVLATGGGIILSEENRATLRRLGPVVWLDANPDILFERVSRNKKRPLLQSENPRATFDALLAARRPIYEAAADVRIDSTGLSHDDAARIIIDETQRFLNQAQSRGV